MKIFLSALLSLSVPAVLYAGTTSITTYYPAPDGNYKSLSSQLFTETGVEQGTTTNDALTTIIGDAGCFPVNGVNTPALGLGLLSASPLTNPMNCQNYSLMFVLNGGSNDLYINRSDPGNIYFLKNGSAANPPASAQMEITTAGNVGVNTLSPHTTLEVNGSGRVDSGLATEGTAIIPATGAAFSAWGTSPEIYANGDDHTGGGIAVSNDGGFFDWSDGFVTYNGAGGKGLRIDGDGLGNGGNNLTLESANVVINGFGGAWGGGSYLAPKQQLSIDANQIWKSVGAGDPALYLQNAVNNEPVIIGGGAAGNQNNLSVYGNVWGTTAIGTGTSALTFDKDFMDQNGNIWAASVIGTGSSSGTFDKTRLDNAGNFEASANILVGPPGAGPWDTGMNTTLVYAGNGASEAYMNTSGQIWAASEIDVGGSIGSGNVRLYAGASGPNGSSIYTANTVWADSDGRLKQNIMPLTGVLPKLDQIRGVSFEWNHLSAFHGHKEGEKSIGIIAQELRKVYPELVSKTTKSDKYMSVDYIKFTSVLLEAVKELRDQNIGMQKQIAALQEQIKVLEKGK